MLPFVILLVTTVGFTYGHSSGAPVEACNRQGFPRHGNNGNQPGDGGYYVFASANQFNPGETIDGKFTTVLHVCAMFFICF